MPDGIRGGTAPSNNTARSGASPARSEENGQRPRTASTVGSAQLRNHSGRSEEQGKYRRLAAVIQLLTA